MRLLQGSWLRRHPPRWAAFGLGAWLLFTGFAKLLDPVGFAAVIEGYGIVGGAALTRGLAWGFISVEIALGGLLALGVARPAALSGAVALLALFSAVTARAWLLGKVHDCGCFGPLLERTPGQTLAQDLVLLAVAGAAFAGAAERPAPAAWRRRLAAVVALAAAVAPPVAAVLAAPLAEGATTGALGVEPHLPWDPPDPVLFAFLDPLAAGAPARALNALAAAGVPVVALTSEQPEAIEAFRWSAGPAFEIVAVPRRLLRRLSNDRAGAFLVRSGVVQAVWRGRIPAADELGDRGRSVSGLASPKERRG
jgi:hypothetical protein